MARDARYNANFACLKIFRVFGKFFIQVLNTTSLAKVYCACTHLTTFAAGLIVPPNNLDFNFILNNANFEKNLTIYTTMIFFAVVYVLLMMWGRRRDKKDQALLASIPLMDNNPKDKYVYVIITFDLFTASNHILFSLVTKLLCAPEL